MASRKRRLAELQHECSEAIAAYRTSAQQDELAKRRATEKTNRLVNHVIECKNAFTAALHELQDFSEVPDEVWEKIERESRAPREERYWSADVEEAPVTGSIDQLAAAGLQRLLDVVDPGWLEGEARKAYRLDQDLFAEPLELVGSVRVGTKASKPQRFANMLLVTADHLAKSDRLNFFDAPTFVAETAALGTRLDDIPALGPEAVEKLRCLPDMADSDVASTVYELLVGIAVHRKGLKVEMLPRSKSGKTPDFRLHGLAVPASIECKRRLGLLSYELEEAAHVRQLYESIRPDLARRHSRVDVAFSDEVRSVDAATFSAFVKPLLESASDSQASTPWGVVTTETLPYTKGFERTRAFAPNFMDTVFGWRPNEEWDGIVCEIDAPPAIVVDRVRCPRAVRWVSLSPVARLKKARGITSLWGDAMLQIPGGEMGFVYIAYAEVNRHDIADARTQDIMDACERWTYRWSISIGTSVVNRLYPRVVGHGLPDFIESAMPLVPHGADYLADLVPACVFTPPPQYEPIRSPADARERALTLLVDRAKRGE